VEYGILSLLPPIVTLLLAIYTGQVIISLFIGIVFSNLVINGWHFMGALNLSLEGIVNVFAEGWATKTIIFAFLIG
jgi:Na+/H+ antiporter NhaC